jgi:hypothetical protein
VIIQLTEQLSHTQTTAYSKSRHTPEYWSNQSAVFSPVHAHLWRYQHLWVRTAGQTLLMCPHDTALQDPPPLPRSSKKKLLVCVGVTQFLHPVSILPGEWVGSASQQPIIMYRVSYVKPAPLTS